MIRKRIYYEKPRTYLLDYILIGAGIFSIMIIGVPSIISQVWAEATSIQTTCVDNQPCHTMRCIQGQSCKVSETPNTDYNFEFDRDEAESLPQPLQDEQIKQQHIEATDPGTTGLAPFTDSYDNNYSEDQEEYLDDRQDMMEDAEYE